MKKVEQNTTTQSRAYRAMAKFTQKKTNSKQLYEKKKFNDTTSKRNMLRNYQKMNCPKYHH